MQIGTYCGVPAAMDSFRIAKDVFKEMGIDYEDAIAFIGLGMMGLPMVRRTSLRLAPRYAPATCRPPRGRHSRTRR